MQTQAIIEPMITQAETATPAIKPSASKGKSRRMKLLERMGCIGCAPADVCITRAVTPDDLCGAFKVVHDNYVQSGYINPTLTGMRVRIHELMSQTATFIAKAKGEVVGVTGAVMDTPDLPVPADKVFHEELEELRRDGRKICEGTNWVIAPEYRRTNVLTDLTRCCLAHAKVFGCDDLLATVSPGHAPFYEMLGFELIGSERYYDDKLKDSVVLLTLRVDELDERFADVDSSGDDDEAIFKRLYFEENPHFKQIIPWAMMAERVYSDPSFLCELFVERTNYLAQCNSRELSLIHRRWGDRIFHQVWGHHVICNEFARTA